MTKTEYLTRVNDLLEKINLELAKPVSKKLEGEKVEIQKAYMKTLINL